MVRYSVIIPVYNAERTLHRCVDSLIAQHFDNVEIILVDDGSTDSSRMICEEYAGNNDYILCISQKNRGVSVARNTGLDAARGEFILFVDSDDYVTPDFFSVVDEIVQREHTDWIQLSGCFENGQERQTSIHKRVSAHSREELLPHIIDAICRKTINSPWAKVYHRNILEENQIRFPQGVSVAEDRVFNIVYSFYIQSYAASERVIYIVNTQNENSLSRKRHKDLNAQFEIADKYLSDQLDSAPLQEHERESYEEAINLGCCRSIYHDAKLMIQDRIGWPTRQKRLMLLCKEINRKRMKYPNTRFSRLITLPVRFYLTPVIDAIAWKLTRSQ